jgi:hypothetical protein
MKNTLPILLACVAAALPASAAGQTTTLSPPVPSTGPVLSVGPVPAAPVLPADVVGGASADPLPAPAAGQLIDQAHALLSRRYSIVAKIRHRAFLFDRELIGVGEYYQGPAASRLMRLELRMQVGRRIVQQLQVNDGRHLWTATQYEAEPELERIDVDRALKAGLAAGMTGPEAAITLGMGGVGRLLEMLRKDFDFTESFRSELDGLPVYGITGRWKPPTFITLGIPSAEKLRPHVPDQVTIYLGCDDLFPYRIDYSRTPPVAKGGEAAAPRPLLKMEFFEVRFNAPLDETLFEFEPGKRLFVDRTDQFINTRAAIP